ncbi:beta-galactosidase [Lutibacter agarilyticus]|uniref:Beta-galactosidase n=1 Tax=Lutibacter agarilyticus TaxID=1109740 RepID=A0A238WAW3_9FLAO|nr:sugar-binding domain-containing protein [Lutibacter agarilyticus]SNR43692.1 beta-galactosidase [Lutibacter agarilyticus]
MHKKIVLVFMFFAVGLHKSSAQRMQFNAEFAPQEGLIKHVEKPTRDEICLNGYWQFMPIELSKEITLEEIKTQKLPTSGWDKIPIKIPSPWNVNGFTNEEGGDFKSFPSYPEYWNDVKSGWLKKTIKVPVDWAENRILLHFEAVAGYAKVFVNGHEIGEHFDSFLPFSFDVTEHAKAGENIDVVVWIAHGSLLNDPGKYGRRNYVAGSFWGIYIAGIWQDVFLQKLPVVHVTDTYIKPLVDKDELVVEVSIKNTTSKPVNVNLNADVKRWINLNGKSVQNIPEVNWTLGESDLNIKRSKLQIRPAETKVFTLSAKVNGALDLWSTESPNLYGLVISLNQKKIILDKDYTRFGWRQFDIKETQLRLNGDPIQIKGDSWHFMGIPQMTRRYAYAWYQMLLDANANGLRLHAQVFPRFYLEMADEMGICVLDETAIWSSDGGPKIDSEIYWKACRAHVEGLILRDRNYPSVMGWSVCNETLPVTKHVFNAPQELIDKNISEINKWVAIVKETDPTRTWISGDGETQEKTDLPTVIGHYGGIEELKRWSSQGKPWGIGETGMGYYGTPSQISKINGDRAYESQLGRMEGLAGEAFELISLQRKYNASYASVFNLAWYGLKPLSLGLKDISKAPTLEDGIFFNEFVEGKPGYQPERLGSYSSTFNPGYDPTLPLYETWPLFDAIKAAYSDNYAQLNNVWKQYEDNTVKVNPSKEKKSMVWLSGDLDGSLKTKFENLAIKFESLSIYQNQLIIVDGAHPPMLNSKLVKNLKVALQNGSTLIFWGATVNSNAFIEALTSRKVEFYNRNATSYIINGEHAIVNGQRNASFYFSELTKEPVSTVSIGGDWVNESQLVLEACNTDWLKWNYQGEDIKTAKVYRNERETKASGHVIVRQAKGDGEIIVSTIDLFVLGNQSKHLINTMITNLGGVFKGKVRDVPQALNSNGVLENTNFYGSVKNDSHDIEQVFAYAPLTEDEFTKVKLGTVTKGHYWDVLSSDDNGIFDFKKEDLKHKEYASVYLSFWMYSPRSLTDLLIEPDMPRLDMHFGMDDALAFSVNGKAISETIRIGGFVEDEFKYEGIPLEKGWNHILIKVANGTGEWKSKVRFSSTKPAFMKEIKTVVDR